MMSAVGRVGAAGWEVMYSATVETVRHLQKDAASTAPLTWRLTENQALDAPTATPVTNAPIAPTLVASMALPARKRSVVLLAGAKMEVAQASATSAVMTVLVPLTAQTVKPATRRTSIATAVRSSSSAATPPVTRLAALVRVGTTSSAQIRQEGEKTLVQAIAMGKPSATVPRLLVLTVLLVLIMALSQQAAEPVTSGRSATRVTCLQSAKIAIATARMTALTALFAIARAYANLIQAVKTTSIMSEDGTTRSSTAGANSRYQAVFVAYSCFGNPNGT